MAGWNDIENVGAIEKGFIWDIKFFNTYRNAFYEKFNYLNVPLNLPDEIDPTKGFVVDRSYALKFFGVMRHLILNVQWIKKIRFDNPQNYGALDDDTDDVWQDYEIEAHIGTYSYDILTDTSLGAYKMEDLFGATLWNSVYKLYKDVFIYVESHEIKSSFMSWEQYGTASSPLLTEDCSPGSGTGCLVTPLNDYCTDQEELEATLLDSGSGRETIRVRGGSGAIISRTGSEPNYKYFLTIPSSTYFQNLYFVRKHTIKNYDDEVVKLEVSAQAYNLANYIVDYKTNNPALPQADTVFTNWESSLDNQGSTFSSSAGIDSQPFSFSDSSISEGTWNLTSFIGPQTPHPVFFNNWEYDLEGLPFSITQVNRACSLHVVTGDDSTFKSDMYYKLNVSGMVYNTPDES